MSAPPTTYAEVKTVWSDQVFTELNTDFDPTGWNDITLPENGKECDFLLFQANLFPVDLDALVTLCSTVSDCDFDSTNYYSYAFGFRLDRGLYVLGGLCYYNNPYLFAKEESVSPLVSVYWKYA